MPRLILTDSNGHITTLARTATTASFFDHCVRLLAGAAIVGPKREYDDGRPVPLDTSREASMQLTFADLGMLRATRAPWIPKQVLSGVPRGRFAWIVYEPTEG